MRAAGVVNLKGRRLSSRHRQICTAQHAQPVGRASLTGGRDQRLLSHPSSGDGGQNSTAGDDPLATIDAVRAADSALHAVWPIWGQPTSSFG